MNIELSWINAVLKKRIKHFSVSRCIRLFFVLRETVIKKCWVRGLEGWDQHNLLSK
jgi:hypothetical protein